MPRCKNEKFMSTVGMAKLTDKSEIDFDVMRNLPDCQKKSAGSYLSTAATGARFDRFQIPQNQFECMRGECVNTGTLLFNGNATVYKFKVEAGDFAAGVLTFYVLPPVSSSATAVVKISDTSTFTNADQYTITLSDMATGGDGYKAVVVDFTQTPTGVGTGWSGEGKAIYVSIAITGATSSEVVGLSTLALFEDMDDFAVSTHVILRCLSGTSGDFGLDVAEQTCFKTGEFDTSGLSGFEKTLTFKAVTPNSWRLNPLYRKGSLAQAWDKETIEATVTALTGTNYGQVVLDDFDHSECGFVSVQVLYDCRESQNVSDALLERLMIPSKVDMDEDHYQLIDDGDGNVIVLFNKVHIGRGVLISYPKKVEVTDSFVLTDEDVNEVRTRMSYVKCHSDGAKYRFVYNNVLVTSFPDGQGTDNDAESEITINIQRDKDGRFGYAYRIVG